MSLFSTIKADIKDVTTSAGKFASAFSRLFKKLPSAIQVVSNFTAEVAPVVVAAVALADPAVDPEVAAALAIVETGLAAVEASAQAATTGGSLQSALQNFSATVPTLLSGLAIKNPVLKAAVERIVTLVVGEAKVLIPAVELWIDQAKGISPDPIEPAA